MKRSRFTENQIISILKEAEAGVPVTDLCRTHGFSKSSFYKWKAKYGGMEASGALFHGTPDEYGWFPWIVLESPIPPMLL
jgi:hypothetical protein